MSRRVRCPSCRAVFSMPEDRGGEVSCPECATRLAIPEAPSRPQRSEEGPEEYEPPASRSRGEERVSSKSRRTPADWDQTREEAYSDDSPTRRRPGRVKHKTNRSPLVWIAGGLGTLVLLGVVVYVVVQVGLMAPAPNNPPPPAPIPPPFVGNGGMALPAFNNPEDAKAALRENVIGRLPENADQILDDVSFAAQAKDPPRPPLPAEISPAAVHNVKRATVLIRVQRGDRPSGEGSGFFALEPGIIVTNAHVVGMLRSGVPPPKQIDVVVFSGETNEQRLTGTVVGVDRSADLAVLRVPKAPFLPAPLQICISLHRGNTQ